ncbi:hydroxymethylcytosylglucuronate/cytosylglucuronate synthase [Streptomyces bugieae]|uniref:Hydroxymethylcytosylglucuronate/cytosylglucurona te synthase n=1 Tax=Streptomyces bugieae TaxID=3098223 RepID=A0ABU7NU95_9ACTN|nr:hydroxymethylcytosylglucuronate/cytosylglucuronate synthase [Streptomyces sp. DSM 41528]
MTDVFTAENSPGGPSNSGLTIAVAGAEFGWGSTGKLCAVMAELRRSAPVPLRFIGLASRLSRTLLAAHGVDQWYDVATDDREAVAEVARHENVAAGLVVLEGPAASSLEAVGVPTVFVDSLPFLWTRSDLPSLPLDASVYCAQRCIELEPHSRDLLAAVSNLQWVEAVVLENTGTQGAETSNSSPTAAPFQRALVSFGGLRSPTLTDWTSYPRVVLPATLNALERAGFSAVHVAGNLPREFPWESVRASHPMDGASMKVTYGPLPHAEFLRHVSEADVLLASPGLTTLLEAGARSTPVVCLPPQNLSQIFNGRFHSRAVGADTRVRWPDDVFSEETVLRDRTSSEDAVLRLIYGGISAAAKSPDRAETAVGAGVLAALERAQAGADWSGLARGVGGGGARQVAGHVLALALPTSGAVSG